MAVFRSRVACTGWRGWLVAWGFALAAICGPQSASAQEVWKDTASGQAVQSGPVLSPAGNDVLREGDVIYRTVLPNPGDPNHAFDSKTGRNFVRNGRNWVDTKTGKRVRSGPVLSPTGGDVLREGEVGYRTVLPDAGDPNHAYDPKTGRNFVREERKETFVRGEHKTTKKGDTKTPARPKGEAKIEATIHVDQPPAKPARKKPSTTFEWFIPQIHVANTEPTSKKEIKQIEFVQKRIIYWDHELVEAQRAKDDARVKLILAPPVASERADKEIRLSFYPLPTTSREEWERMERAHKRAIDREDRAKRQLAKYNAKLQRLINGSYLAATDPDPNIRMQLIRQEDLIRNAAGGGD